MILTHKDFNKGDKVRIKAYYGDEIKTVQTVVRDPRGQYLVIENDKYPEGIAMAITDKVEKVHD